MSLIEACYSIKDIFFQQRRIVCKAVHHFSQGALPYFQDLSNPQDIVGKLPDKGKVVFRFLCGGPIFPESIIKDMVQAVFHSPMKPPVAAHLQCTHFHVRNDPHDLYITPLIVPGQMKFV